VTGFSQVILGDLIEATTLMGTIGYGITKLVEKTILRKAT
jgi:hypothetical protein